MGENAEALGQRLAQARRAAGLTQQELCHKAGLSYSTLAKIERGAIKAPSVFTVTSIATATGTTVESLLGMATPQSAGNKKTSKTGIKFIYFDLNGTLVRGYAKAFPMIAKLSGMPMDTVEATFWRYDDEVCSGQISMDDYNRSVGQKLGLSDFDWTDYYLDSVEPVEGIKELIDWTASHYEIGLLSGTMPGLIDGLDKAGKLPLDKFSQVVDSSEVKMLKTSPKIYELALAKAGYAPEQTLLVDDDKIAIVLADKAGWQISRFNSYEPKESIARVKKHLEF